MDRSKAQMGFVFRIRSRLWWLFMLTAALLLPIGAVASADSEDEQARLAVSATLEGCEDGEMGISCKLGVVWGDVEGADRYTAAVRLADGALREIGVVGSGPGRTTLAIPYAGDGTYTVTITAWGRDEGGKDRKIADEESEPEEKVESEPKQSKPESKAPAGGGGGGSDRPEPPAPAATDEKPAASKPKPEPEREPEPKVEPPAPEASAKRAAGSGEPKRPAEPATP